MTTRRRRRSSLLIALGVGLLAAGCSLEETLPHPDCLRGGTALIVAQSVTTADQVPCLDPLPAGWEVATVMVDQDGTVLELDSDRAGASAATLRFEASCDLGDAVSVPSEQPGTEAFEYIDEIVGGFRAERFYLFPGGCVRLTFDFDAGARAGLAVQVQDALTFVTRDEVNDNIKATFVDAEL